MESTYRLNPLVQAAVKGESHYRGAINPLDMAKLLDDELDSLKIYGLDLFLKGRETGMAIKPFADSARTHTMAYGRLMRPGDVIMTQVSYNVKHPFVTSRRKNLLETTFGQRLDHQILAIVLNEHNELWWALITFDMDNAERNTISNLKVKNLTVPELAKLLDMTDEEPERPFFGQQVYEDYCKMLERKLDAFRVNELNFAMVLAETKLHYRNAKKMYDDRAKPSEVKNN